MPGPVRWLPGALLVLSASASLLSPASVPRLGNLLDGLESAIARSRGIKCPFFRRRAGDALEAAVAVAQFVGARHKSLEVPLMPRGDTGAKTPGLALAAMQARVPVHSAARRGWAPPPRRLPGIPVECRDWYMIGCRGLITWRYRHRR